MVMSRPPPSVPARSRAARACDPCRRRKTKCNGRIHCLSCSSAGLWCSYGSSTRHLKGTEYVAYLESRVTQLEGGKPKPDGMTGTSPSHTSTSTSSPTDTSLAVSMSTVNSGERQISHTGVGKENAVPIVGRQTVLQNPPPSTPMLPQIAPRLDGINQQMARHYGGGSGFGVLHRIVFLCGQLVPRTPQENSSIAANPYFLDCPLAFSPPQGHTPRIRLPSKSVAQQLIQTAFNEAFPLWPFADESFVRLDIDSISKSENTDFNADEADLLGLVYALMSLGLRWVPSCRETGEATTPADGSKSRCVDYFETACSMLHLGRCGQSLCSIQLMMSLAQYLKTNNAASKCHSYISAATSSALRIGLHETSSVVHPSSVERVRRERTYNALRMMDTLTSCSLGIPRSLPAQSRAHKMSQCTRSDGAIEPEALSALVEILGQYLDTTFSGIHSIESVGGSYAVPYERLQMVGEELNAWSSRVAQIDGAAWLTKGRVIGDFCYFYVHLLIHSPFIHHLANPEAGMHAVECAAKAVDAASHLARTAEALEALGALEAYPFAIEALALATAVLRLVELSGTANAFRTVPSRPPRRLLERLATHHVAARECVQMLCTLDPSHHSSSPVSASGAPFVDAGDSLLQRLQDGWSDDLWASALPPPPPPPPGTERWFEGSRAQTATAFDDDDGGGLPMEGDLDPDEAWFRSQAAASAAAMFVSTIPASPCGDRGTDSCGLFFPLDAASGGVYSY